MAVDCKLAWVRTMLDWWEAFVWFVANTHLLKDHNSKGKQKMQLSFCGTNSWDIDKEKLRKFPIFSAWREVFRWQESKVYHKILLNADDEVLVGLAIEVIKSWKHFVTNFTFNTISYHHINRKCVCTKLKSWQGVVHSWHDFSSLLS